MSPATRQFFMSTTTPAALLSRHNPSVTDVVGRIIYDVGMEAWYRHAKKLYGATRNEHDFDNGVSSLG